MDAVKVLSGRYHHLKASLFGSVISYKLTTVSDASGGCARRIRLSNRLCPLEELWSPARADV